MAEVTAKKARIASVVAATAIALGCGANYAYSAWGPAFARRLQFNATQQNLIGVSGNMGMYAMGIPAGLLNDNRPPRWGVLVGAIALAAGYFPIHKAYHDGPGSMSVSLVSFCSFLTGLGSCTAFSAAIKTTTYNWPEHRGTATAFPMSGFGLSAFFFASISALAFADNTSDFLLLLAIGTFGLNAIAFFFIRLIPSQAAHQVRSEQHRSPSPSRRRRKSSAAGSGSSANESLLRQQQNGTEMTTARVDKLRIDVSSGTVGDPDETASLMSARDSVDNEGGRRRDSIMKLAYEKPPTEEITGLKLLTRLQFWMLFVMFSLLAGVGLMTINNIGNDARALWLARDPNTDPVFIQQREQMHVSILSIGSFLGRLLSGIGSDYLIKTLHASRLWCLTVSSSLFILSQLLALTISTPTLLFLVSSITGLSYGALFGVFPALTADAFGVSGLSLNWGFMILAPVVSGNVFNLSYGRILDARTAADPSGGGECMLGLACYRDAYWITLASSVVGFVGSLWAIRYERAKRLRRLAPERDRVA